MIRTWNCTFYGKMPALNRNYLSTRCPVLVPWSIEDTLDVRMSLEIQHRHITWWSRDNSTATGSKGERAQGLVEVTQCFVEKAKAGLWPWLSSASFRRSQLSGKVPPSHGLAWFISTLLHGGKYGNFNLTWTFFFFFNIRIDQNKVCLWGKSNSL